MTLPVYPNPISLNDIEAEFGGIFGPPTPPATRMNIPLSNYYSGGSYVPAGTIGYPGGVSTPIPSSGVISISNFHGATKRIPQLYTFTSSANFYTPAGMTKATIIIVGAGGRGGSAIKTQYDGGFTEGGGGGAGAVIVLSDFNMPADPGNPFLPAPLQISIGANTGSNPGQAGTTSVIISGYGTVNAAGGYSGDHGVDDDFGTGGTSGSGFAGGIPIPGVEGGGGGGGATGVGAGSGGPGYTFTLGGTTRTVGIGGDAGVGTAADANTGNGGGGASRMLKGTTTGAAGASGVVYIYG